MVRRKDNKKNFALGVVGLIVVIAIALAYYGPSTGMATAKCSDWDDGYNPVYKGTCTDANGIEYLDTCVSPNIVREHYCMDDTTCISELVNCDYGCAEGACV